MKKNIILPILFLFILQSVSVYASFNSVWDLVTSFGIACWNHKTLTAAVAWNIGIPFFKVYKFNDNYFLFDKNLSFINRTLSVIKQVPSFHLEVIKGQKDGEDKFLKLYLYLPFGFVAIAERKVLLSFFQCLRK